MAESKDCEPISSHEHTKNTTSCWTTIFLQGLEI